MNHLFYMNHGPREEATPTMLIVIDVEEVVHGWSFQCCSSLHGGEVVVAQSFNWPCVQSCRSTGRRP